MVGVLHLFIGISENEQAVTGGFWSNSLAICE